MASDIAVGIAALGIYLPQQVATAEDLAHASGLPLEVVVEKLGIRRTYVAGNADHVSHMAAQAAQQALTAADVDPADVDLLIYHGSEYKDFFVWSAAAKVQHLVGARNAAAYEIYALCAGAPIALRAARDQMRCDETLRHVLLVTAARENDLVDPQNPATRFMLNFGAGGAAMLLRRGQTHNQVLGAATLVDGSLSEHVVMRGGGTRHPTSSATLAAGMHMLDVEEMETMRARLGELSLPNFVRVVEQALARSGATRSDLAFLCLTHMKPSFHHEIVRALGLREEQALYLSDYGHIQSVDQPLALHLAAQRGLLRDGDLVALVGAGTGYTWSAALVRWGAIER